MRTNGFWRISLRSWTMTPGPGKSNQCVNGTALLRCRSTNRPVTPALWLTAFPPIARFSGVVSNGNDYSFFWQFNGDYIVWEAFQNQASCTGIAGFFEKR